MLSLPLPLWQLHQHIPPLTHQDYVAQTRFSL
jgi:hypothetical protein